MRILTEFLFPLIDWSRFSFRLPLHAFRTSGFCLSAVEDSLV